VTDTEVNIESPDAPISTEELADAIADAELEVAHTLEAEAEIEEATELAESAVDIASQHDHSEYARVEHTHPELDTGERLALLESRIATLESELESEEVDTVEEIEPTPEPAPEPKQPKRRHRFGS